MPDTTPQATGIEALVCADIARRQQMGLAKYGTTLEDNLAALPDRLRHAYEEALDISNYLRWAMEKMRTAAGPTVAKDGSFTETITWWPVERRHPDSDIEVLMRFPDEAELSVEPGWLDADGWHYCESGGITPVPPIYWADMPEGPQC